MSLVRPTARENCAPSSRLGFRAALISLTNFFLLAQRLPWERRTARSLSYYRDDEKGQFDLHKKAFECPPLNHNSVFCIQFRNWCKRF